MSSVYKAIVFDMDGVLWDSSEIHREAFATALASYSISSLDYEAIAGMSTPDAMRKILAENCISHDDDNIRTLVHVKRRLALSRLAQKPPLKEGCKEVLQSLRHLKLGLATSGSRESAKVFLEALGSTNIFHSIVTGEDVARSKPWPDIFSNSFQNLEVGASEALVVEDSLAGIQAAKRAGALVAALVGTHDRADLLQVAPTYIIETLGELIQYGGQNIRDSGSGASAVSGYNT